MLYIIKLNYNKIILGIIILLVLIYIFTPRSLTYMAKVHKMPIDEIDFIKIYSPYDEDQANSYSFYKNSEIKEIINLMDNTYVRKKLFRKKEATNSKDHKSYIISIVNEGGYSKFPPSIYLFTDKIINFNSKQYVFYNKGFSDKLNLILDKKF